MSAHPSHEELNASGVPSLAHDVAEEPLVRFGRTTDGSGGGSESEVYKMTLGEETIILVPLKMWNQLDTHKWVARGKLPGSPPGLEVTHDHVKIAGETVSITDPEGPLKLEKVFSEWLSLERETMELARKKLHAKPPPTVEEASTAPLPPPHFQVEVDKVGHVHIRCVQGKETLATIGLNVAGFKSLYGQGMMRKPHALQVGALHDWVEIDGTFFSFEKGNNEAAKLEQVLNESYLPHTGAGEGKDILIFSNPASSTGFDIQFPVMAGGVRDNRRRPLNEESLDLLQDSVKCGLLHSDLVIKISRPTLIFKRKTSDGGERYLPSSPDNLVTVRDEDGNEKIIDLSHPVSYLTLTTLDLAAVFNHPSIHKHSKVAARSTSPGIGQQDSRPPPRPSPPPPPPVPSPALKQPSPAPPRPASTPSAPQTAKPSTPAVPKPATPTPLAPPPVVPGATISIFTPLPAIPGPNEWLRFALETPSIRHDWFTSLVYAEMAAMLASSSPGKLGLSSCWAIAMGDTQDVSAPEFKGVFLTEKGGFGFVNQGHIVRFNKGVAFIGTQEAAIEAIGVNLIATGFDSQQRVVFIVTNGYRSKFGVAEQAVEKELAKIEDFGAVILSVEEVLASPEPLDVIWTVPAVQEDPLAPKAVESRRPEAGSDNHAPQSNPAR